MDYYLGCEFIFPAQRTDFEHPPVAKAEMRLKSAQNSYSTSNQTIISCIRNGQSETLIEL